MLFRTAWLSVAVTMVMGLAAASHADDWGTVVAISSTMGVHGDRVCVGEATRGDIGCPTYAPYVSATSGFMGIGTNSPTTALDVNGRIRTNNEIISNPTASAEGGHLILAYPTSSTISGQGNGTWNVDVFSDKSLRLFRRDVSGVALTPFQIFENGNVGIGKGASTQLDVSGTVSATRFVGDGSQLTGVVASTADRIVSGTTSLLAVSSTGFVSLTQAGTNTGWFDPTRGLVTLGVSTTGAVSGTSGYFGGLSVRHPVSGSTAPLYVRSGASSVAIGHTLEGFAKGTDNSGAIYFGPNPYGANVTTTTAGIEASWGNSNVPQIHMGVLRDSVRAVYSAYYLGGALAMSTGGAERLRIDGSGNVGVGVSPSGLATLSVSGTVSATQLVLSRDQNGQDGGAVVITNGNGTGLMLASPWTGANDPSVIKTNVAEDLYFNMGKAANSTTPTVVFSSNGNVGINVTSPTTARLEVSGTVSATRFVGDGSGLTNLQGASADRIVSGTTSMAAVSSTGFVSLTQAGTNTGWFDPTRGLVTLGVSATGRISATSGYFTSGIVISSPVAYRAMVYKTNGLNRWQLSTNNSAETGSNAGSDFFIQYADDAGIWSGIPLFVRRGNGNIGMNTTDPSQTLHVAGSALTTSWTGINFSAANVTPTAPLEVSGTVSATYVKLADNDDVPCTPERKGTLRFSNGIVSICRAQ